MKVTSTQWLEANRRRARVEGLAMMTYNPSIGRVLASGGVEKFKGIAWRRVCNLGRIRDRKTFDRWHHRFVMGTSHAIKFTARRRRISYGQAQKPVNVFLKVYVDWAGLPDRRTVTRLAKFLHVPLDSIVMGRVRADHRRLFEETVAPVYRRRGQWPSDLQLPIISRSMYLAWQEFFRTVRPTRTIDLDVIWSRAPREE